MQYINSNEYYNESMDITLTNGEVVHLDKDVNVITGPSMLSIRLDEIHTLLIPLLRISEIRLKRG